MIETTLHRTAKSSQGLSTPASVARLDAFLNYRLLTAASAGEGRRWWALKVHAKRQLSEAPAPHVGRLAEAILHVLEQQEAA